MYLQKLATLSIGRIKLQPIIGCSTDLCWDHTYVLHFRSLPKGRSRTRSSRRSVSLLQLCKEASNNGVRTMDFLPFLNLKFTNYKNAYGLPTDKRSLITSTGLQLLLHYQLCFLARYFIVKTNKRHPYASFAHLSMPNLGNPILGHLARVNNFLRDTSSQRRKKPT